MVRWSLVIIAIAGLVWLCGFYEMGGKSLAGHLSEIYRTPLVQEKVTAFDAGFEKRVHTIEHSVKKLISGDKKDRHRRDEPAKVSRSPMSSVTSPSAMPTASVDTAKEMPQRSSEVADVRPNRSPKGTAQDALTDSDRAGLDHLLSQKLNTTR